MTQITVAALQLAFTADIDRNIAEVSRPSVRRPPGARR